MELTLSLDHDSAVPLHRQVYTELRRSILTGRLLPGQRVPSTRSLSQAIGISRTTVNQGYEQLLSEGYLETRHGSGTFVCGQLPDAMLHTEAIAPVDGPKPVALRLSKYAQSSANPVRLLYVTPSHQFPTGATLSLSRRLALLQWAQQTGAMIIEDDYDSEYRYGDKPIPALQGLDSSDSVIYLGTFSKVLFPSLRIGYLVLPPRLVPFIAQAKWLTDRQLPMLEQKVLTDFIEAGHLESHIRKMRSHYDRLRQALVQALQQHFGSRVEILGEKAGIHVMVRFSLEMSGEEILARSLQAGIGIVPAGPCYLAEGRESEFILGYGELEEGTILEAIRRLADVLQ